MLQRRVEHWNQDVMPRPEPDVPTFNRLFQVEM